MKLSLIICVYNTPMEYLTEALESIARSTLRDYEICMVDDGSTEDYTALAARYGVRLQKTENSGILAARLRGIEMAQGEYCAFFDSDDTISVHYHQPMLEKAAETDADIVINGWAFHTAHTRYATPNDSTLSQEIDLCGDEVLLAFAAQAGREQSYYVTWNKIYRREILKTAAKCIAESPLGGDRICYGEDMLINFYAFREAKRVCNVRTGYYFYRIHANQSVQVIHEERLRAQLIAMADIFALAISQVGEHPHREQILRHMHAWRALMSRTHYSHAAAQGYKSLYPLIMEKYGVTELKRSTWHDSSVYYRARLLPDNIEEIDAALRPLFDVDAPTKVCYARKDTYVKRMMAVLKEEGKALIYDKNAEIRIPREQIRFRNRVLHNDLIYAAGVLLFPKGSGLRAWLKRIL
ncbi:MAG: glycosyltransferase family 2 protein [Clostridia bacterium]|nr:glycosyltransferase family 2 protein [Clostridia bacterium]